MSRNSRRTPLSYRDPHGHVQENGNIYYRVVDKSYEAQYAHLKGSGLYAALLTEGLITAFEEIPSSGIGDERTYKILLPEQLEVVVYPYEWSFAQWKDCLLFFLRVNTICLQHGMILKDASPFNFCLLSGKMVLFDILSFEFYKEGDPWIAYRQFCENFLAPLALMRYRHPIWSKLYRASPHGIDLGFASCSLPFSSYFSMACLLHIHLHSSVAGGKRALGGSKRPFLKKEQLVQMMDAFKSVGRWKLSTGRTSFWDEYYGEEIQAAEYLASKDLIVEGWLKELQPETVTDLGANTGRFSLLAAKHAKKVIAVESDPGSVELLYQFTRGWKNIYPVCADITDPSPGSGWENAEKSPLLERIQSDTLMALALIHHLRITYNVPLQLIASLFAKLSGKNLVLEFVPRSDEKVKAMLAHRQDIYDDYAKENIEEVFSEWFILKDRQPLGNSGRLIYLWEKK